MLFNNRELDRAFEFISKSDFDIFCLQEVPEEFLKRLQTLPYFIDSCSDFVMYRSYWERFSTRRMERCFVVTLSKHPITVREKMPFPDYWPILPWRTRVFVWLMWPFYFSKLSNREGLYTNILISEKPTHIFNLHLILANPDLRLKEFEMAMAKQDISKPTIVCGDLNILEKPHITPLNWLLGGKKSDTFCYRREREQIEKQFSVHKLTNAFSGKITHPLSRSQLDHILISNSFSIKNTKIISDRYGSDHHPIFVELT
jgi:endonuclease/exonuclease/phosphatase family metal-dependent hydrolase